MNSAKRFYLKISQSKLWFLAALALSGLRLYLLYDIPIVAYSTSLHDDALMVSMAAWLNSGMWLGPYGVYTMPKGILYPLYLVFVSRTGISYMILTQLFYMLGAVLVIIALRRQITSPLAQTVLYLVLIFNPIMASAHVMLRIYRNVLVPAEVLMVFAGILGMFMRLEEKNRHLVFWSFLTGFGILALDMTREDSVWIMPFFVTASLVFVVMIFLMKSVSVKERLVKGIWILLPFLILVAGNGTVKVLNHHFYGVAACTDTNDTHFTDAVKAMYSVKDTDVYEKVSVSRSKMNMLYQYSETLSSVRPYLDAALDAWSDTDDGNVTDAHFFWAVRDGLSWAGYYQDAKATDAFYQRTAEELNAAMDDGRLEKQSVMPSALMSPWRKGYLKDLMEAYGLSYAFISSFYSSETIILESWDNGQGGVALFESLTNCKAVYPGQSDLISDRQIKKQNILNRIFGCYSRINQVVLVIALLMFATACVWMVVSVTYRKEMWKLWLSLLGILLSAFVLVSGVAYTHISAYPAISVTYLAGVYPLMLLFEWITIFHFLKTVRNRANFFVHFP